MQAVNHLLENAIASTPAGGRVELRVARSDSCVVEVADTGVALSFEDAANLAMPLWRAPTTARRAPDSVSGSRSRITSAASTAAR